VQHLDPEYHDTYLKNKLKRGFQRSVVGMGQGKGKQDSICSRNVVGRGHR
jgi:hypothetical protein